MSRVIVSLCVALVLFNSCFSQLPTIFSRNFPLSGNSYVLDTLDIRPSFEVLNTGMLNLGYGFTPAESVLSSVSFESSMISFHKRINYFLVDPYYSSFNLKEPLTAFEYQNGQYGEELFSVIHAQNINTNNCLYFRYRSVSNDEYFLNSENSTNIFSFNLNGQDKLARVFYNTHFSYGIINQKFFHGLQSPVQFSDGDNNISPLQYSVNTPEAISKSYDLKIKHQMLYFLDNHFMVDSLNESDSISNSVNYLMHYLDIDQGIFGYIDPMNSAADSLNNWYANFVHGSANGINSRLWTRQINNTLEYVSEKKMNFLFFTKSVTRIGFKTVGYTWGDVNNSMNSYGLYLDLNGDLKNEDSLFFNYNNEFGFGGVNLGDFNLQGSMSKFYSNFNFRLAYFFLRREPNLIYSNLNNDFFQISNDFNKEFLSSVGTYFNYNGLTLSNRLFLFNGLIYLNDLADPSQTVNITYQNTSSAQWDWETNRFGGSASGNFQIIRGEDVIRVPVVFAKSQVFLKAKLFNKVLDLKTGINVYYFSEFKANLFYGPLMDFYLQNSNEIGGYPFADFFVNFKLKTGRIFINVFHPHAGLIGNDYFFRYGYPQQGFMLRIGANWILQD